jgi:Xaa-Pro aminopeptidase
MGFAKAFEPAEFDRRVTDVKRRMESAGFDLLICQDPANMGWLTGFDGWSFYTPQAVLVHVEEATPLWFGRAQDAKSAHITTDIPAANIISFSEPLVHHQVKHPFDELCELIVSRRWGSARVGVDLDAHYYTARAHRHLVSGLPNATISDNRELVNWARLVKSDAELVYMREAGRIVTETMTRALASLKPGVPQHEIVADVYHTQITGYDGKFGDYTSLCPLIQVGEGTSTPHLTWTGEPLPDSGLVVMELGAARRHYHAPLTRTAHLGAPPDPMAKLAEVIVEGGNLAIDAAKPGVTCAEVEALWQGVLNRNGYSKDSRVGYSIGLNYPPDWGERTASLRAGDETVLQAGMCFHFQSGVWLEDFGAAISESIVITDRGGERLSNAPRELIVIE